MSPFTSAPNEGEGVEKSEVGYTKEEAKANWVKARSDIPMVIQKVAGDFHDLGEEAKVLWNRLVDLIEKGIAKF